MRVTRFNQKACQKNVSVRLRLRMFVIRYPESSKEDVYAQPARVEVRVT